MSDPMTENVQRVAESDPDANILYPSFNHEAMEAARAAVGPDGQAYRDILTARLFFRAAFPVMKVPLTDDPKMKAKFAGVRAVVQFRAENGDYPLGCWLQFSDGEFRATEGIHSEPDLTLAFPDVAKLNALLTGGVALPRFKGALKNPGLLLKTLMLLMSLMLMMPSSRPKDPLKKYLKVKMTLYMITTALSVYNKIHGGEMAEWTARQPDRIYQFSVESENVDERIAAYLRVKAGRTKAGRGIYRRRRPFVHFRFQGPDGALPVLLKDVEFVESVERGFAVVDGSPEYSAALNDFMGRLQGMLT